MFSGPPAKKKAVTFSTPLELTIVTWNVWFDNREYHRRMEYILNHTLSLDPDIACFQEVLGEFVEIILHHPQVIEKYSVSPFHSTYYGVLTLVKKEYRPTFHTIEFPTQMGRELLKTTFEINQNVVTVGNVHLESLASQKCREEQLKICAKELSKSPIAFLVGDFNFCSERNFIIQSGVPLENDVLARELPEFHDLWKTFIHSSTFIQQQEEQQQELQQELQKQQKQEQEQEEKQTEIQQQQHQEGEEECQEKKTISNQQENLQQQQSDPQFLTPTKAKKSESDTIGYTFDSEANPMILQVERMRYDRIMAKFSKFTSSFLCSRS